MRSILYSAWARIAQIAICLIDILGFDDSVGFFHGAGAHGSPFEACGSACELGYEVFELCVDFAVGSEDQGGDLSEHLHCRYEGSRSVHVGFG